ncbi:RWD domain-containing protein 1-like [Convolutriloba macropyga]|uniref:RWD domain-containing protein 1-like n=1 Tax=Convolutriloba macropyga TaxID=536237 RepID=UPI003F52567A
MSLEEQEIEIDALRSIYPEEFELTKEDAPFELKVFLVSQPVDCGPEDDPEEFETKLTLLATLPETYPEVSPEYRLVDIKGLDDMEFETVDLAIKQQIEDNMGMSMIFAICSEIQNQLSSISEQKMKAKEAEIERKKKEQEEIEMQRLIGTPVTVQSFLEWKAKFDAEVTSKRVATKAAAIDDKSGKITGKQLFLQDNKLDSSDLAFLEGGIETMEINESLFQEEDDFDIEDDELSDD